MALVPCHAQHNATDMLMVPSYAELSMSDDTAGFPFVTFLTRNKFPVGRTMPRSIVEILYAAFAEQPAPVAYSDGQKAYENAIVACRAKQAEYLTAAHGLLALHDVENPV